MLDQARSLMCLVSIVFNLGSFRCSLYKGFLVDDLLRLGNAHFFRLCLHRALILVQSFLQLRKVSL